MPGNNTSQAVFFYTYILHSRKDREHYIGYTQDLPRRLEEHRGSKSFATQYRLPVDLIYYEACLNESDAKQREKYLKSTAGRRFLAKRLKHFNTDAVWHQVK
jgi:putative endonuclease